MDEARPSTTPVCYRHPDRATRLACSECGKPICVDCSHDSVVGQKCAECAKPIGRNQVIQARDSWRASLWQTAPVSAGIIAAAVAVFVAGFIPDLEDRLFEWFVAFSPFIRDGEVWRLFTVTLLHANFLHIGFNMYLLYILGPQLERQIGSGPFAALFLASAGVATAFSVITGAPNQLAVGASGAVFGIIGAWFFVAWKTRHTPAGNVMFRQIGFLAGINLVLGFVIPRVDWRAHLGGFIAGIAIAFVWSKLAAGRKNAETLRLVTAAPFIAAAIVAVLIL